MDYKDSVVVQQNDLLLPDAVAPTKKESLDRTSKKDVLFNEEELRPEITGQKVNLVVNLPSGGRRPPSVSSAALLPSAGPGLDGTAVNRNLGPNDPNGGSSGGSSGTDGNDDAQTDQDPKVLSGGPGIVVKAMTLFLLRNVFDKEMFSDAGL